MSPVDDGKPKKRQLGVWASIYVRQRLSDSHRGSADGKAGRSNASGCPSLLRGLRTSRLKFPCRIGTNARYPDLHELVGGSD